MSKGSATRKLPTVPGFKKIDHFYIGLCNSDVISGYCLEVTTRTAYIWRFILPAYDKLEFLHLALGERFFRLPLESSVSEIDTAVKSEILSDWQSLSKIKDRNALLADMDERCVSGIYPVWVRFLTQIRNGDYPEADKILLGLDETKNFLKLPIIAGNYQLLVEVRKIAGWEGCTGVLNLWSTETSYLYA